MFGLPRCEGRPHTIIGAGTLGRRIALMWLSGGGIEALEEARTWIDGRLLDVLQYGRPGRLELYTDMGKAVENAWLVTESISEIRQIKVDLLGELDAVLPHDCILATNSSSFMGSELWDKVTHKERFLNTHYYMPPERRPVELMPTDHTASDIIPFLEPLFAEHGLIPYHVKKQSIGLVANRIWAAIKREACFVVSEGVAEPAVVDNLMRDVFGLPVFSIMDQVGLDVARDIEQHYLTARDDIQRADALDVMNGYIAQGKLGIKTGEGFFRYNHQE